MVPTCTLEEFEEIQLQLRCKRAIKSNAGENVMEYKAVPGHNCMSMGCRHRFQFYISLTDKSVSDRFSDGLPRFLIKKPAEILFGMTADEYAGLPKDDQQQRLNDCCLKEFRFRVGRNLRAKRLQVYEVEEIGLDDDESDDSLDDVRVAMESLTCVFYPTYNREAKESEQLLGHREISHLADMNAVEEHQTLV